MENIIEFKNIFKSHSDNIIFKDFNLSIKKGDFVTIIGTSGCGKSTILKMVNSLEYPDKGEIFINGENVKDKDLILLRRKMGYCVQGNVLFPHMNIEKNISYVLNISKSKTKIEIKNRVLDLIKIVNLDEDILKRYPHQLSGGQQQRVGILRSLANSPEILLMDEPFGAVDQITREKLQQELSIIHKKIKTTILFVTHDISEALKLGTKVLVISNANIDQYGTPEEILNCPKTEFVRKLISKDQKSYMLHGLSKI